ncbi:MAG: helix-hairpin-helix domain-containing protein [Bacillota bacterium]
MRTLFGRREQLAALVLAAAIVFGLGYVYAQAKIKPPELPVLEQAGEKEQATLLVHVAGEVNAPGVYRVEGGARVVDAVEMARPLPSADLQALNLAAPLQDGQKVLVPRVRAPDAQGSVPGGSASAGAGDSRININTADRAELENLPGIGPALAERIIRYREQNGPFVSVDDLMNVSGIGEKRLEGLRDMATTY